MWVVLRKLMPIIYLIIIPGDILKMDVHPGNASKITLLSEHATTFYRLRKIWQFSSPVVRAFRCLSNNLFICGCMMMAAVAAGDIVTPYYGIPITITAAQRDEKVSWALAG